MNLCDDSLTLALPLILNEGVVWKIDFSSIEIQIMETNFKYFSCLYEKTQSDTCLLFEVFSPLFSFFVLFNLILKAFCFSFLLFVHYSSNYYYYRIVVFDRCVLFLWNCLFQSKNALLFVRFDSYRALFNKYPKIQRKMNISKMPSILMFGLFAFPLNAKN